MKWSFIVFCIYLGALFFFDQRIPGAWVESLLGRLVPGNIVIHVDSLSFGFRHGIYVRGLKVYDSTRADPTEAVITADSIGYYPLFHRLRIEGLSYLRLPDSYYDGVNTDRNQRLECSFPEIDELQVVLIRPDVLGIRPERLDFRVESTARRMDFRPMHLIWPDADVNMTVDGFCYIDLDRQEVYGEIDGLAKQPHIRPLLETLDVSVAFPYFDGFTEVPEPCKSWCAWKVDLVRSDFDLWLDLHPVLGKYNDVPLVKADGKIHLHNCTRDNCLNYVTTVGPVTAVDAKGRLLDGSVVVVGTNRNVTVDVNAKSSQPLAHVLRVAGFTGDYVDSSVFGDSECRLQFRFPRAMTNNYEVMNGFGHFSVKNGQLMRLKGFKGLIEAMPSIAPAVTWLSDSTQASCDYVIENGVLKSDNIYIEGTLFSIKMFGKLDIAKNEQDFTVRVQFAKKDSIVGKVLHPLTWPFTKLLLEFRVTGSPEHPKWKYLSVVDRVIEVVK